MKTAKRNAVDRRESYKMR